MTKVYIVRHGETEWNVAGRMQGCKDSKLTNLGIQQAKWLSGKLKDENIDIIYSSPLNRARNTAELIRGNREIEIFNEYDLRELELGEWEGLSKTDVEKIDKLNIENFWNNTEEYNPPRGGETFQELINRSYRCIMKLVNENRGRTILLVSHTITIKSFMAALQGFGVKGIWNPPFLKQTALTEIDFIDEKFHILKNADTSHYEIEIALSKGI